MTFDQAMAFIFKVESGYVSNPNDPGGETNFGLSQRAYPDLNIKILTKDIAAQIYQKDYWDALQLDQMPPEIRLIVFDCAVNQGKSRAVKILQNLLGIVQDGYVGQATFAALKVHPVAQVFLQYAQARHDHYTQDVRWPTFGKGWSKRLLDVVLESSEII